MGGFQKHIVVTTPWLICDNFNCVMKTNKRIGSQVREGEIRDMKTCMV